MEATDKGNKRKLSETNVDKLLTKQKWKREEGRFKAIKYFDDVKEEKLTWVDVGSYKLPLCQYTYIGIVVACSFQQKHDFSKVPF